MAHEHKYDIFISYAREEAGWVKQHLYEPLLRCQTAEGKRPRIFLDVSEEGINVGESFSDALAGALQSSDKFLPVYSRAYFKSEWAAWELVKVFQEDPSGHQEKINPILLEAEAAESIPFKVDHIQHLDIRMQDWFQRLAARMNLTPQPKVKPTRLAFQCHPSDTSINHTLEEIEVAIEDEDGIADCDDEVSIAAENGELQGSLSVLAVSGRARFVDLSFRNAVERTRLIARAKGHQPAFGRPFTVLAPAEPALDIEPESQKDSVQLKVHALDAFFFENGEAVALIDRQRIVVYRRDGSFGAEIGFSGRIKTFRRQKALIGAATWPGQVLVAEHHGGSFSGAVQDQEGGFTIPGDLAFDGESMLAGFWNGALLEVRIGHEPRLKLRHDAGIQALTILDKRLYLCDLKGQLCIYEGGKCVQMHELEPTILMLKAYQDCIVAVGRRKLYHFALDRSNVIEERLQFCGTAAVLGDVDIMVIIDEDGKGFRYDKDLVIRSRFHTRPGAVPTSADNAGHVCIFHNPDGSRTLMVDDRVVHTHLNGAFAISQAGDAFILGDDDGAKIFDVSVLPTLYQEAEHG